jgi:hypothetical protein
MQGLQGDTGSMGRDGQYGKGTFTFVNNILNRDNIIEVLNSSSIYKSTSTDGWNANIYSLEAYNKFNLSFSLGSLTPNVFIGLSSTPSLNTYTSNIEYGYYINEENSVSIYENDFLLENISSDFTRSTVFGIQYNGRSIEYYIDGYLVYSKDIIILNPLHANFILYSSGYSIENIHFDPLVSKDGLDGSTGIQGLQGDTGIQG